MTLTIKVSWLNDHWFHIHNYLTTYKLRCAARKHPGDYRQQKAYVLASQPGSARLPRYGDRKELLPKDWIPEIPGINAKGSLRRLCEGSVGNSNKHLQASRR